MNGDMQHGKSFWIGLVLGWALIIIGVRGLIVDHALTNPANLVRWLLGLALLHDLVLAPAVYAVAWAITRAVPRPATTPLRVGLATSGLLIAFAWPLVRAYGRRASNPTALPLDYGRNLALSLAVVWAAVAAWIGVALWRDHHRSARAPAVGD